MKIPENWHTALSDVQSVCRGAVIGGGCLRDLDNGRPIKDIDIFIRGTRAGDLHMVRQQLVDGGLTADEIDPTHMYPVGDGNDVVGHFDVAHPAVQQPLQIIMVNFDTSRICERFDFGICRIAYDGITVTVTDEYRQDKANRIFKLRRQRTDAEMVASVHRYARLSQKYSGWRFALFDEIADFDPEVFA